MSIKDARLPAEVEWPGAGAPVTPQDDGPELGREIEAREEEAKPVKQLKSPEMLTQAEIDRHRIDHIPYRCWCPDFVEVFWARKSAQREQLRGEEHSSCVVGLYVFFLLSQKRCLHGMGFLKDRPMKQHELLSPGAGR